MGLTAGAVGVEVCVIWCDCVRVGFGDIQVELSRGWGCVVWAVELGMFWIGIVEWVRYARLYNGCDGRCQRECLSRCKDHFGRVRPAVCGVVQGVSC